MTPEFKRSERVALREFFPTDSPGTERSEACLPGFLLLNLAAGRGVASSERGDGREGVGSLEHRLKPEPRGLIERTVLRDEKNIW